MHEDGEDRPFPTPGKVGGHPMQDGDIIVLQSAGGGGYGDPLTRDPEAVLEDVVEGYVSIEEAKRSYGVIIHNEQIDHSATVIQRTQQMNQRHRVRLTGPATTSLYEDIGRGQKRVARLHPDDAAAINVVDDQMMELLGSGGAPIRAWVRIDTTARVGHLELDARGYEILRVAPDQEIQIRPLFRPQLS
jgi:N-methylhydantoinase B